MKNLFLLLMLMIFSSIQSFSEKAPVKYGDVPPEDLLMTVYPEDTSADAVILCDYGYFDQEDFSFTRILRIKILKKSGCSWGNMTFPPYADAVVKGITFNMENGQVVETKLESSSIFKENIYGNIYRLRIAMPNVRPGSVIDIKYYFPSLPNDWKFQSTIPVRHSELIINKNAYVSFRYDITGFQPLFRNEDGHWIAKNMPAFKPEPFLSSIENYITKMTLDVLEINYRGVFYKSFTTSLESMSGYLWDNDYFEIPLRSTGFMNSAAKEIEILAKSDNEKIRLAYDYVKKFKWNEYQTLYTTNTSLKTSLEKQSGNSADINLTLIQLLTKLKFQVTPILMSTRENGFLSPIHPSLNRLNTVIACVNLNGKQIFLDATEQYAPYDLIPEKDLNLFGWIYNTDNSGQVDIMPEKKEKKLILYNVAFDEDMNLSGTMSFRKFDYAALDFRKHYKSFSGQDAFLDNMLKEYPGMKIRNANIENIDSISQPISEKYDIILKNAIDEADGNFYLYPMLLHRMNENPFKAEQRKYPVDYVHQIEDTYSITINIPENMDVASFPKNVRMSLPDNAASFIYQINVIGKTLQFNCKFSINKVVFGENEYPDIKEFYNQIIVKEAEPVILKRL